MKQDRLFWKSLETLVANNEIVIDREKGTRHPKYPEMIYPTDYGYLKNTSAMDGGGIDIFIGSCPSQKVHAVFCTVDLMKNDAEIKILIGCTGDEKEDIYHFLNYSDYMKALLVEKEF